LFFVPCWFSPLPRPIPPCRYYRDNFHATLRSYLRCLHVEFSIKNSYVGCTRFNYYRVKNYFCDMLYNVYIIIP
jgi:hypothetical protein